MNFNTLPTDAKVPKAPKASKAPQNIVLIGMMGVAKTTGGRAAAAVLNMPFVDSDIYYVEKFNEPIAVTFQNSGEQVFRERETQAIQEIAQTYGGANPPAVIALGGGAVLRHENIKALKNNSVIICLTARPEVILKRVEKSTTRPLLKNPTIESVTELYNQRKPLYEMYADATIDTSFLGVAQIAQKIKQIAQNTEQ